MIKEYIVSGTALTGEELEARNVTIVVKDNIISAIEEENKISPYWICPAFFNAHTHLADTVAMDFPCTGTLEELVTPPYGLKHQILAQTPQKDLIAAMQASMKEMYLSGTAGFADFREGGRMGVDAIRQAATNLPIRPVILGREGGEDIADGAGISSARDVKASLEIAEKMKKQGKLVGFHAGEQNADDIDIALDAEPDFLVHCTHATRSDIQRIADMGVPVVICCRSNVLLEVASDKNHPPIQEMIEAGIELYVGTDNAMFVQPDIMQELSFINTAYGVQAHDLLISATRGFSPAGISHTISVGNKASFFVLDISWGNLQYSRDIKSTIVKRAPLSHFCATIF